MNNNINYIPLGFQCTSSSILKKLNLRKCSYPFDWIISNPKNILLLLELLFRYDNIENFVKNHFFVFDKRLSFIKPECFIENINSNIGYNSIYKFIFPHDNYNEETINKYIRRFERLKKIILSNECCKFLFINRIVLDNNKNISFTINNEIQLDNLYNHLYELFQFIYNLNNNIEFIIINAVKDKTEYINYQNNFNIIEIIPENNIDLKDNEIINNLDIF